MSERSTYSLLVSRIAKSPFLPISITTLLICLILSPYAMNGFWGDDASNSQIRFGLEREHGNLWEYSFGIFWYWLTVQGRLMAGFLHGYSLFYLFSDLQSLHLAQCAMVLLNIALFSYILFFVGFKRNLILISAILFVGFFQITDALDPVAAFAFHYPTLTVQLFIPLILVLKWTRNQQKKYLVFAMIFWFWSMMYYEINIIFIFAVIVFIFRYSEDQKARDKNLLLVADVVFVYILLALYIKSNAVAPNYSGSAVGEIKLFLPAYLKQLSASFPLSNYLSDGTRALATSNLNFALHSKLAWAILLVGTIIFYTSTKAIKKEWDLMPAKFDVYVICILMLLLPPVLPSISVRYQLEVGWGRGTLPVYYQYFGASLMFVWLLSRVPLQNRPARAIISLAFALYLSFNTITNLTTIVRIDEYFRAPRELFISQAREGLFREVRDGDIVEVRGSPPYVNANLIFQGSGKRVIVQTVDSARFREANVQSFVLTRNSSGRYEVIRQSSDVKEIN